MSSTARLFSRLWVIAPLCALGCLLWITQRRVARLDYVSNLAQTTSAAVGRAQSEPPAGFPPTLIVPERNEASFEWIMQTEQMVADPTLRIRHADYDSALAGRTVWATSPYRWWLRGWLWADGKISGADTMTSMNRVARYAEPGLQALTIVVVAVFVAFRFGRFATALFSVGVVSFFPFAAGFLPGVPDHHGWSRVCAMMGALVLVSGIGSRNSPRWFATAGAVSAIGLWFDVPTAVLFLLGTTLGGMVAAVILRRPADFHTGFPDLGWRWWSLSGAVSVVTGYLLEYAPSYLGEWHVEYVHPIYAIAWLGLGEMVEVAWSFRRSESISRTWLWVRFAVSLIAVASVPFAMKWTGEEGFLKRDLFSFRLTNQPAGVVAENFWNWVSRDGFSSAVWATVLPLMLLVPAIGLLTKSSAGRTQRVQIAVVLGVVGLTLVCATQQLRWWCDFGVCSLVLLVVATADTETIPSRSQRWIWGILTVITGIVGLSQLWPRENADAKLTLTVSETEELVERDLSQWLARRTGVPHAVVFAPPHLTLTLAFYGGLRGVGTFSSDNKAGFGEALMITGADSIEEVYTQLQMRAVRYVVVPSWDPFFEEFGRLYLNAKFSNRKSLLIEELKRWNVPPWLRPVAYPMPVIPGFEKQSARVFEVVDPQKPAVAMSRLGEYLAELGEVDQAGMTRELLKKFPGDVSALVARAQIARAQGKENDFAADLRSLLSRLQTGGDRYLPWDRRVGLAVVLAQGGQLNPARDQTLQCIKEIDADKIRSLSISSLYQLVVLCDEFKVEFANPKLRKEALDLLPDELRHRL